MNVQDRDREAAKELQRGFVKHSWNASDERDEIAQAIAKARAEGVEDGRNQAQRFALANAACLERDSCADTVAQTQYDWEDEPAACEALAMAERAVRRRHSA